MDTKNYGLIEETEVFAKDWRLGGVSGSDRKVLRADRNYLDLLPEVEYQMGVYFDTMACVSFSALNCIETTMKAFGHNYNYSDRFLAKLSGTTKQGNSLRNVAESIRLNGLVDEEVWSFPRAQRNPVYGWHNYYEEIPEAVKMEGKKWLNEWDVSWEWIPPNHVREALKYAPVQVGVKAYPLIRKDGLFDDAGDARRNHAVMLADATDERYTIFDHYDKAIKYLVPDYDFKWALQYHIKHKSANQMPMPNILDNTLLQEVEVSGTFGLYLNGKIIVDETSRLLATWLLRNNGDTKNKTRTLRKVEWDSFPKMNLRSEAL